jgi:adhesin HecA-like repeat protein
LSFNERSTAGDSISIKVKRHNSTRNAVRKFFGLADINTAKSVTDKLTEDYMSKGYLTALYRRYNPDSGSYSEWSYLVKDKPNLMTSAGMTFIAQQTYAGNSGGSIGTNGGNFVAVTATAITPARGDTTLSGELDNTNGFGRAQGTVVIGSFSGNSISLTITKTFTASGAQSNVQASGLFTASSSGTLVHEATFTSTTFATNDQLQIVWTITLSS